MATGPDVPTRSNALADFARADRYAQADLFGRATPPQSILAPFGPRRRGLSPEPPSASEAFSDPCQLDAWRGAPDVGGQPDGRGAPWYSR